MAQYAYAKPPVFYYQTIDRRNLQFTNYPVFSVHNPQPPPPAPTIENEGQPASEHPEDGPEPEAAADDVGEVGEGQCELHPNHGLKLTF